jgi:hypothetical protein
VVFRLRSGAGSSPCCFKILAIVPRCYVVSQVGKRSENPSIAPIAILLRHPNHQGFDLTVSARPSRPATVAAVILLRNQFPVPGQQGFWRHEGSDLGQESPSQSFRLGSQAATLFVIQPKPLITKLLAENAILFAEVFDHAVAVGSSTRLGKST